MTLFLFLTIIQAIIAAALVGVILMQKSEGGGLGVGGGSPAGFMSARGAADFLTRTTAILATLFVVLSIALAVVAVGAHRSTGIDDSIDRSVPDAPASNDPLQSIIGGPAAAPSGAAAPAAAPSGAAPASEDPLAPAAGE